MREEVETEFTERMEQLRNMYMSEIESQVKIKSLWFAVTAINVH